MKRLVLLFLALCLSFSFAACAGSDNDGKSTSTTPTVSSTPEGSSQEDPAPPVSTPEQTEPPVTTEPPTKIVKIPHNLDLGLDKISNGNYKIMGYRLSDKKLVDVESKSKPTWSPDWPGHFVTNTTANVANKPEGDGLLDLMPAAEYGAAIVFTAPTDSEYSYSGEFNKRYKEINRDNGKLPCRITLTVMTSNGTILEEKTTVGDKWDEKFSISGKTELKAGEQLLVIVTRKDLNAGGYNLALISFKTVGKIEVAT